MEPPLTEKPTCLERLGVLWEESPGTVIAMLSAILVLIILLVVLLVWHFHPHQPLFTATKQHITRHSWPFHSHL